MIFPCPPSHSSAPYVKRKVRVVSPRPSDEESLAGGYPPQRKNQGDRHSDTDQRVPLNINRPREDYYHEDQPPKSNRPSSWLDLRKWVDPVEEYIEGLSDSKRLTLLKFLISRHQTVQPGSYRWSRRPGCKLWIPGEKDVTKAYERVASELLDSIHPTDKSTINEVLTTVRRDSYFYEQLDRCISILTEGINQSEKLQRELLELSELEVGKRTIRNCLE